MNQKLCRQAVINCINWQGLLFPEKVVQVSERVFRHTATNGTVRQFEVFEKNEYFARKQTMPGEKLHKALTYYIVETRPKDAITRAIITGMFKR